MTFKSRIQKIEQAVNQVTLNAVLLREPAEGDDHKDFDTAFAHARNAGQQVIIHTSGPQPRQQIAGVIYEASGFNACLAQAAHSPATDGHSKNMLEQILNEVKGSALPIVQMVKP